MGQERKSMGTCSGRDRRYSLDYVDEEADAQVAGKGIWACEFVKPWEWRRGKRLGANDNTPGQCRIKGNINRKGERIYIVFQARGHMWMRGSQGLLPVCAVFWQTMMKHGGALMPLSSQRSKVFS